MGLGEKMKRILSTAISLVMIFAIPACGAAEPDLSERDIENTAVAAAWIAITETQAALPSPTPVPPTSTPEPTPTFIPTIVLLPTLPPPTAAVAATPTAECSQIPAAEPKGTLVTVEFTNESQGSANLAFGMLSPNEFGECFTYSYTIGRGDALSTRVVAGCYWGYAWITGSETSVARSGDAVLCVTNSSLIYHVRITKETVNFK